MDIRRQFGKRLRELRLAKKLSQESLAHESNLDRTYIPSIEKGARNVSLEVIHKLSKALNIKMTELLKGLD